MVRVLIVDDNEQNLYLLRTLLDGNQFTVDVARNGAEALRSTGKVLPDLIISDLLMPVLDGYTLLRHWKTDDRLKSIPFIVYTATYTDPKDKQLALDLGADAFLVKPSEPEPFLECVRAVLANKDHAAQPVRQPQVEDEALLSEYSETLVRKLEKKSQQLEQTNQALLEIIAEHKRANERLRDTEQRYRSLFHAITDPMFVYDCETLAFLDVNEAAVSHYGYSRDEFLQMTLRDIRPPEEVPQLLESLDRYGAGFEYRGVWQHRKKNGDIFEASITTYGLTYAGRKAGVVQARDVTHQRRVEAEAKRTAELLQAVADGTTDAVFVKDHEGKYLFCNQAAAQFMGKPLEQIIGHTDVDIFDAESADRVSESDRHVMQSNQIQTREEILNTSMGQRTFQALKVPYRDDKGRVIGLIGTARDITAQKQADAERHESEERFRQLAENIGEVFWLTKSDHGKLLYVSPSYERIWGRPCDELYRNPQAWVEAIHEEDRPRIISAMRHEARGDYSEEYRVVRPDGTERWVFDRAFPIRDTEGEVYRIAGVAEDVTERKAAEAALLASNERFRLLANATNDAIWDWDLITHALWWSEGFETLFGFRRDEVESTIDSWISRIHSEDRQAVVDGVHQAIDRGDLSWSGEYRFARRDGSYAYVLDRGRVIRDSAGKAIRMVGGMTDLTDRKQAEDELRLHNRAIQAASQGILITDPNQPDNPIIFVSAGFERMTGYRAEEVQGQNCRLLQGKDTNPATVAEMRTAIAQQQTCSVEILNYRRDGAPFWNQLTISPVVDDGGELTHFVGVQTDVTARRALEEQFRQAQKMEVLGQLAGGVAHDFNNLLTIIIGYSDHVLDMLPADAPVVEMIAEVRKAGERASKLTRQLLILSRQQVMEPRLVDLNQIVGDTEKMLRRLIGEDVQLNTRLLPNLKNVHADPGQLEQVVLNLAVNARDAMPQGGKLTIETQHVQLDEDDCRTDAGLSAGEYVLLAVSDTGGGMDEATRAKIFEPFFTTKDPGKGTGLGLATVHSIVKQWRGHIAVTSEPGQGATFSIYLPVATETSDKRHRPQAKKGMPAGTETILLVEDDVAVRELAARTLRKCGYHVLEAGNGQEALEMLRRDLLPIDLLISDVVMPLLGGRALAEQVNQLQPDCRVLFISGYTDDAVIRHGVTDAELSFLQKPLTPTSLAQKARQVLDQTITP